MQNIILILVFVVFVFLSGCLTTSNNKNMNKAPYTTSNNKNIAPDFLFKTIDGETITLSQFKGKVVILQAMASWCPSCRLEALQLKQIYEKYANKGLVIISIDVQPQYSSLQDLKNFKRTVGANWYFGFYPEFIDLYGIRSLDSTIIVDKNMNIVYKDDTITPAEKLEEIIKNLLSA